MRNGWKAIWITVAVFSGWYLFTQPAAAGHTVHSLLHMLQQAGSSMATFLSSIH